MSDRSNIHSGHRARMRKRFINSGRSFKSFSEHEMLEMLLYNCYKRRNTNEIAHDLINRFGSVEKTLTAPVEELCTVKNVNLAVAANIRFYGELYRYLLRGEEHTADIGDPVYIDQYLAKTLAGRACGLYILSQNDSEAVKLYHCDRTDLFPVKMKLLSDRAQSIVSVEYLQSDDRQVISQIEPIIAELSDFCSANDIEYLDHYIYTLTRLFSLKESDMF